MKLWLMIYSDSIVDTCLASSIDEASFKFRNKSSTPYIWFESIIISEADLNNEIKLNSLKNKESNGNNRNKNISTRC